MFLSRKHSLSAMYDETVTLESPHGLKVSVKVETPRYRTGDPVEDGSPSLALYRGCRAGHRLCGFILKRYVCSRLDRGQPRLNSVHEGEFSIYDDVICDGGVDVATECQGILQQAEVMQVPTLAIAMSEAGKANTYISRSCYTMLYHVIPCLALLTVIDKFGLVGRGSNLLSNKHRYHFIIVTLSDHMLYYSLQYAETIDTKAITGI